MGSEHRAGLMLDAPKWERPRRDSQFSLCCAPSLCIVALDTGLRASWSRGNETGMDDRETARASADTQLIGEIPMIKQLVQLIGLTEATEMIAGRAQHRQGARWRRLGAGRRGRRRARSSGDDDLN